MPRDQIITTAREFARNAEKTNGRSMVIVGAGLNHWYHMDMNYRGIINMLVMCGCVGQSGGGWSHYVGQEKLRPQTGWLPLAFGLDWGRPPRQMNSTSAFYAHTDQWRYETLDVSEILSPTAPAGSVGRRADRLQCARRAHGLAAVGAAASGQSARSLQDRPPRRAWSRRTMSRKALKSGELKLSCEDPDNPKNWPRNLFVWRSNLLGASGKGHEYFLKHLLGTKHGVMGKNLGEDGKKKPAEVVWHEEAPEGKLDLLVTLDFRMSTTCMYSDIVLPTATWYEKNDLNTSDMHPFIHPLTAAVDPVWGSRSDWDIYKGIAEAFSKVAPEVLGVEKDVVLTPIMHDTPGEIAQPFDVKDWKKGEIDPIPGRTMPAVTVVERDYPNLYKRFTSLGPLMQKLGNGGKGMSWNTEHEVEFLKTLNGEVLEEGVSKGLARIDTDIDACEVILSLAPETNGEVAVKAWASLGGFTGREHTHLAIHKEDEKIRFRDVVAQPRKIISSPIWSGLESEKVCYNAGYTNVHELIPWRTLTGRQQLYQDHLWMRAFGEGFCVYRPPIDTKSVKPVIDRKPNGNAPVVLNFITPHQKWGIHSTYTDNLLMLTLSRGGPCVWISETDAKKAGIVDNDWIEALQHQRRAGRARRRLAARQGGHVHDVSRPGEDRERAGLRADRPARRHPQLGDAHRPQADPHDRRLRPASLGLQLLRHRRLQPRRVRHRAQDGRDRLARPSGRRPAGRSRGADNGGRRMKIRAQIAMVLNLDKCIGCHTCSVTCKNVWTSREGMEYAWFNNVETKPGIGYPKDWENQKRWKGGWRRKKNGKIEPRIGAKWRVLANIFANPDLPEIDDYYEPFTFDYEHLQKAPEMQTMPTARPRSLVSGERMEKIEWGPNWEEILGGEFAKRSADVNFEGVQKEIYGQFENTFMMYLPRLCEHCLNPACVAACPSGAIYKREEDGIVLIDQDKCRGWRMCVSGCPYKKIYYNWSSGKSEKCIFCFPRIEAGQPTVCSETCVGRIRYLGVILYDADRIEAAASVADEQDLYQAQLDVFLDPNDPAVIAEARAQGIPENWIEGAIRSPIWKMAMEWKVAFPLHPEYRTLPMVWYVPPLSPIQSAAAAGSIGLDGDMPDVRSLRIPLKYLANLLTAGKEEPVALALERMLAMRGYMRAKTVDGVIDEGIARRVGLRPEQIDEMYQIMAIANYEDRFVIPTAHRELGEDAYDLRGSCGFSFGNGCSDGTSEASLFGKPKRGQDADGGDVMAATFKALSALLSYPTAELQEAAGEIRGALRAEAIVPPATRRRSRPADRRDRRRRSVRSAGALRAPVRPHALPVAPSLRARAWRKPRPRPGDDRPEEPLREERPRDQRDRAARFPAAVPRIPVDASDRGGARAARPDRAHRRRARRAAGEARLALRGDLHGAGRRRRRRSERAPRSTRCSPSRMSIRTISPRSMPPGRTRRSCSVPRRRAAARTTWSRASGRQNAPRHGRNREHAMREFLNNAVFGWYPYLCLTVFIVGSIIRFDREQYTWRSGSSQLLRRRQLMWGSNLFHVGILVIFAGHFVGLLTPIWVFDALGISHGFKQMHGDRRRRRRRPLLPGRHRAPHPSPAVRPAHPPDLVLRRYRHPAPAVRPAPARACRPSPCRSTTSTATRW